MLDHQPELAHRLATTTCPLAHQRGMVKPTLRLISTRAGVGGVRRRAAGKMPMRLVESFSLLPSLQPLLFLEMLLLIAALELVSLPSSFPVIWVVVCTGDDGDRARVRRGPRYDVLAHTVVVVWLKRRVGVRAVQQDRRGGRVVGQGRLWLWGGVMGGCEQEPPMTFRGL